MGFDSVFRSSSYDKKAEVKNRLLYVICQNNKFNKNESKIIVTELS